MMHSVDLPKPVEKLVDKWSLTMKLSVISLLVAL